MFLSKRGILLVVSGPAGSGKGTIVSQVLERRKDFVYSVSATTRPARSMEQDGVQYYFITKEEFERRIERDEMLEYAEYCGNYYGTPKKEILHQLEQGNHVILEIEVQGALRVKELMPQAVLVMVLPPDFKTLEQRLRGRGTNTEQDIQNRLATSRWELSNLNAYDYVIPNETGKSEQAAQCLIEIVDSETHNIARNPQVYEMFFGKEEKEL